jgi:hypothetical protein
MNRYNEIWNEKNFKYLTVNELRYQRGYCTFSKSDISDLDEVVYKSYYGFIAFLIFIMILSVLIYAIV